MADHGDSNWRANDEDGLSAATATTNGPHWSVQVYMAMCACVSVCVLQYTERKRTKATIWLYMKNSAMASVLMVQHVAYMYMCCFIYCPFLRNWSETLYTYSISERISEWAAEAQQNRLSHAHMRTKKNGETTNDVHECFVPLRFVTCM